MIRAVIVAIAAFALAFVGYTQNAAIASARPAPPNGARCKLDVDHGLRGGAEGIIVNNECVAVRSASQGTDPVVQYRTLGCLQGGQAIANGQVRADISCGGNVPRCKRIAKGAESGPAFVLAYANQVRRTGAADWVTLSFWCPQHQDPATAPTATDVRDRVIRLLPRVAAKTTAPNTLVNIQTLLWAATDAHRDLGRVSVLGQPVWLRLDFDHADWDFGDGQTDVTATPGKTYDPVGDRCTTVNCPDYYGHTYRTTGPMTITVTVSWNASYSLDGRHFAPVGTAPVTGPAATVHIRARQARAQLVAD